MFQPCCERCCAFVSGTLDSERERTANTPKRTLRQKRNIVSCSHCRPTRLTAADGKHARYSKERSWQVCSSRHPHPLADKGKKFASDGWEAWASGRPAGLKRRQGQAHRRRHAILYVILFCFVYVQGRRNSGPYQRTSKVHGPSAAGVCVRLGRCAVDVAVLPTWMLRSGCRCIYPAWRAPLCSTSSARKLQCHLMVTGLVMTFTMEADGRTSVDFIW